MNRHRLVPRLALGPLVATCNLLFVMRLRGMGEFLYGWVPIAIGVWYASAYRLTRHRRSG